MVNSPLAIRYPPSPPCVARSIGGGRNSGLTYEVLTIHTKARYTTTHQLQNLESARPRRISRDETRALLSLLFSLMNKIAFFGTVTAPGLAQRRCCLVGEPLRGEPEQPAGRRSWRKAVFLAGM